MAKEKAIPLSVKPIISYPREAQVGKSYLMTIDLETEQNDDDWPYEQEEYPVYCMLHTSPLFTNKPLDTPAVVLHRFGGSYGAARFVLTAAQKELEGEIRVTLVNGQGVPLQILRLAEIQVIQEALQRREIVISISDKVTTKLYNNVLPQQLEKVIGSDSGLTARRGTKMTTRILDAKYQLQAVGQASSGLDNIDVSTARDLGIKVLNSPEANSVAEHTMAFILALARHLLRANQTMKEGQWLEKQLKGLGLTGRTLGIIGFGRIGGEVAKRAQVFGMRIVVNQPRLTPELALEAGVSLYSLSDLLAESDFVTLHVPLRPENIGLIGHDELKRMKSSAFLINTARGGIVDEQALLQALEEGEIAGAGIDVFAKEPVTNSALARHPKVIASPHIAGSTDEAQRNAVVAIAEQIIEHVDVKKEVAVTLSLEMVPTELVISYESFDPKRAERLAKALKRDGLLVNPPIVAKKDGKYIILDGATRLTAFKQLAIPHIVVQVVDPYREDIALHTWYHLISGPSSSAELRLELNKVPGLQLIEKPPTTPIQSFLQEPSTLAYFTLPDGSFWLAELDSDIDFTDSLSVFNKMVHQYTIWGDVARTLMTDLEHLRPVYPEMAALAVFPQFEVDDAFNAAIDKNPMPEGITRFIIPGRILRLNVPLDILQSDDSLIAKRRWLDQFVQEKLGRQRVRYYHEPVVLLED